MKSIRRKLSLLLAVIIIMGTMVMPVAASGTAVAGGSTQARATALQIHREYVHTLRSSNSGAVWFKFKTMNYYANYGLLIDCHRSARDNRPLTRNISAALKRANGSTISADSDKSTPLFTIFYNLAPNSWYYLVFKNPNRVSGIINIDISCSKDEDRNSIATAKALKNERTYKCSMCPSSFDKDFYKFVPAQTGTYKVIVQATDTYGSMEYLEAAFLRSGDHRVVEKKYLKANRAAMISTWRLTRGRTYYIRVIGHSVYDYMGDDGDGLYKVRISKIN